MPRGKSPDKADLIEDLKQLAAETDGRVVAANMEKHGPWNDETYRVYFGSWDDALRAAGLKPTYPTEDEVITDLNEVANELGRTPSALDYKRHGTWSSSVVSDRFGGWNTAREVAGLPSLTSQRHGYTPDEALTELERINTELDRPLKTKDLDDDPDAPHTQTYHNIFDSLDEAVRQSNIEYYRFANPTDKEILEDIRRESHNGEPPTIRDYKSNGLYSPEGLIETRFDTWRRAIAEAGLTPRKIGNPAAEEDLLSELESLRDRLGKIPSYNEMTQDGNYCPTTYERHFGSWLDALIEAGYSVEQRVGNKRPPNALSPQQMEKLVNTVNDLANQKLRLSFLFLLFMGTSPESYSDMTEDWIQQPDGTDELFVHIPEGYAYTSRTLEIPNTWKNPANGKEKTHHLKDLVEWHFSEEYTNAIALGRERPRVQSQRVAMKAGINWKNTVLVNWGEYNVKYPDLQARDLRETHGVHLARNGAESWQIQRRLGLESEQDAQYYINQIE